MLEILVCAAKGAGAFVFGTVFQGLLLSYESQITMIVILRFDG